MKLQLASLFGLLALGPLAGCAGDGSPPEASERVESRSDGIIASVDVGYGTVTFHEFREEDGTVAIAIGQLTPNTYGWTPLHDTAAKSTNLEIFLALVPDQDPPQSYVDAHPGQAAELGRETDAILDAAFDADAPVEKTSQQCKNWITPVERGCYTYTYINTKELNNQYGTSPKHLALTPTSRNTTSGICNDGSANVQGRLRWAPGTTTNFNNPGWTPNVPPGEGWVWFGAYVSGTCTAPPGQICIPPNQYVTWRIEGKSMTSSSSNTYDLRGASIYSEALIPKPGCWVN